MIYYETKPIQPGRLVKFRGRRCMVLPSGNEDLITLKPLGGSDNEITSVYLPLQNPYDKIEEDTFPMPTIDHLDNFASAKLLYDACKLSFRNSSGPFRCLGKLSFRPRSYQIVPLIMALKQPVKRLLIADDVGVGKTIEALLILKEMLDRGEIKRFAIICLPHLCDQWYTEIRDKIDIETEIIRSSTIGSLERKIYGDETVFSYYPYQIISIDYVKSEKNKKLFLNDCPEMVIVDEAHSCAKPAGQSPSQQLRYYLLSEIVKNPLRHLLLLTATPHSGKDLEFQSLLGLIKPEFELKNLENIDASEKKEIAQHYIQRKRENIEKWLNEDTPFPKRDTKEFSYELSKEYREFYAEVLKFARGISVGNIFKPTVKMKYWAALGLLRGVMSSPDAGMEMLTKRKQKLSSEDDIVELFSSDGNPVIEKLEDDSDQSPVTLMEQAELEDNEIRSLLRLREKIQNLNGFQKDNKLSKAKDMLEEWLKQGYHPIIFCKYIASAKYLEKYLSQHFGKKNIEIRAITSELGDEERKEKVEEMGKFPKRILIATDCLSEGINLQHHFNAVMHYDLPWNPNRLEQRDGRVDRFGQTSKEVKAYVLYGEDNPIDIVVLKILLEKIRQIQKNTGVYITLGEDNRSIMDIILREVLLEPETMMQRYGKQLSISFGGDNEVDKIDQQLTEDMARAERKGKAIRSIFAHDSIKPEDVELDMKEADEAIGNVATVEVFVKMAVVQLGGSLEKEHSGYIFRPVNMEKYLVEPLGTGDKIHISFESPTPEGYRYIGRNHRFVEQLCHKLISLALEEKVSRGIAKASVFQTELVDIKTVLIQFRVRNVIREKAGGTDVVTEEMYLWGYDYENDNITSLEFDKAKKLLLEVIPLDISIEQQKQVLDQELKKFKTLENQFLEIALGRSKKLVESHTRFSKYLDNKNFEAVEPVLPPDVLGVYVMLPKPKIKF